MSHLTKLLLFLFLTLPVAAQQRSVAVTIDDLPVVGGGTLQRRQAVTEGLLRHLKTYRVPAVGFVNERGLGEPVIPARLQLLSRWLESGMELGNHTYFHPWFYDTPYRQFLSDFKKGERATRPLMKKFHKELRYFRHPYLSTGPDLKTKQRFEAQLQELGYTVAPVTLDNEEWRFARAYDKANGRPEMRDKIVEAYLQYMTEMVVFFEQYSKELVGREPAQVLLLHANALNAHHMDKVLDLFSTRGYKFVSLEAALKDPVYTREDRYIGKMGVSWLQRWATTEGRPLRTEPRAPDWIRNF